METKIGQVEVLGPEHDIVRNVTLHRLRIRLLNSRSEERWCHIDFERWISGDAFAAALRKLAEAIEQE